MHCTIWTHHNLAVLLPDLCYMDIAYTEFKFKKSWRKIVVVWAVSRKDSRSRNIQDFDLEVHTELQLKKSGGIN